MSNTYALSDRANQFWKFSLRIYRLAPAKARLRALQQQYGANINILLFCCWFAHSGQGALTLAKLRHANTLLFTWNENITRLLRKLRNTLPRKAVDLRHQKLQQHVLQDETQAEKIEQATLAEHIFCPQEEYTYQTRLNHATAGIQSYLELLTVPPSRERDNLIQQLIDCVFSESTTHAITGLR